MDEKLKEEVLIGLEEAITLLDIGMEMDRNKSIDTLTVVKYLRQINIKINDVWEKVINAENK